MAVPGRVVKLCGNTAVVNIMNNTCEVNISLVTPKVGDYVLVHAGCVLEVLKKDAAEELMWLFEELKEAADGTPSTRDK